MVLDSVVSATLQHLGDFSPLVVDDPVHEEQNPLFLLAPGDLLYHGVEVVVPALSALLSDAVWEVLSNQGPFLGSIRFNELEHSPVLLSSPRSFNRIKF